MSYESLLTDMFYRNIDTKDVCGEDVFVEKISEMLSNKLNSGKTVKWMAESRVELVKRSYGICGYKTEDLEDIGEDLSLTRNYVLMLVNRTLKFIENMVVDLSCKLDISYDDAIIRLFGCESK